MTDTPLVVHSALFDKTVEAVKARIPDPKNPGKFKRKFKYIVHIGGMRSGKSRQIMLYLAQCLTGVYKEPMKISVFRSRLVWAMNSIFEDFQAVMQRPAPIGFNIWNDKSYNKSTRTYYYNNNSLQFFGLDNAFGEVKGRGFKTHIAYFNEVTEISFDAIKAVAGRCTGFVIMDLNPSIPADHWLLQKFSKRSDCIFIHSTYKDNPFLQQTIIDEIESLDPSVPENVQQGTADEIKWRIFGLGERGVMQGRVYPEVHLVEEMPDDCDKYCYGLDFGFTNSKAALVKVGFKGGSMYVDLLLYKSGLTNLFNPGNPGQENLQSEFERLQIPKHLPIYADCAEPKAIADLQNCGYNVKPAPDKDILAGVTLCKSFKMHAIIRKPELVNEFESYVWGQSKSAGDVFVNKPVKVNDHAMDAMRYAAMAEDSGSFVETHNSYGFASCSPPINDDKYDPDALVDLSPVLQNMIAGERSWLTNNVTTTII